MLEIFASVFPDAIPQEGLDLQDFYIENRVQFWGLFALFPFFMICSATTMAIVEIWSFPKYMLNIGGDDIGFALALFLTKIKRMIFHGLMVVFFLFSIGNIWFYLTLK